MMGAAMVMSVTAVLLQLVRVITIITVRLEFVIALNMMLVMVISAAILSGITVVLPLLLLLRPTSSPLSPPTLPPLPSSILFSFVGAHFIVLTIVVFGIGNHYYYIVVASMPLYLYG